MVNACLGVSPHLAVASAGRGCVGRFLGRALRILGLYPDASSSPPSLCWESVLLWAKAVGGSAGEGDATFSAGKGDAVGDIANRCSACPKVRPDRPVMKTLNHGQANNSLHIARRAATVKVTKSIARTVPVLFLMPKDENGGSSLPPLVNLTDQAYRPLG